MKAPSEIEPTAALEQPAEASRTESEPLVVPVPGSTGVEELREAERHLATTAKHSVAVFAGKLTVLVVGFGTNYLLARLFGAEVVGQLALVQSVVTMVSIVTIFGLDVGLVKYIPRFRSREQAAALRQVISTAFVYSSLFALAGTAAILATRGLLARHVFEDPALAGLLLLGAAALWPTTLVSVAMGLYKGYKRAMQYTWYGEIGENVIFLGLIGAFALFDFRLSLYVVGAYVAAKALAAGVLLKRASGFGIRLRTHFTLRLDPAPPERQARREFLAYSSTMILILFVNLLLAKIDIVMIGVFMTSADVGVYKIAYLVSSLVTFVLNATNMIFPSIISELYSSGKVEQMGRLYSTVTKWVIVLTLPLVLSMVLFPGTIMAFFGPEYVGGAGVLVALAVSGLVNAAVGSNGFILNMSGHEKLLLLNNTLMAVINVILNALMIPRFGLLGAAVATAISISTINLVKVVQIRHLLGIFPYRRAYLHILLSLGCMLALSLLLAPLVRHAFAVAALTLLNLGVAVFVASRFREDLDEAVIGRVTKWLRRR